MTIVLACLVAPVPIADAAVPSYCSDGVSRPNNTDLCFVRRSDFNATYIAEVTGNELDCIPTAGYTPYRLRVRVVGDYEAVGNKFHVRSLSIRYVSGAKPWAYFQINVVYGNGADVDRPWNLEGNWITRDGASRVVENTTNLYPPVSYSPTFGRDGTITFRIYTRESDNPIFPQEKFCTGQLVNVQMRPSSLS